MSNRGMLYCSIVLSLVLMIAGCGGGSDVSSPTVSGVAAAGAPLAGTAYLKDSSIPAQERSVPIAADGSFSFDVAGLTAPFLLKATGTAIGQGTTLFSCAAATGITNINPLSHLAVVMGNGSDDLTSLYNAPDPLQVHAIMSALPNAITNIQTVLQPTLAKFGAASVNFISDPFVANHKGLDLLLDMADFSVINGVVTITDRPANHTFQMSLESFKAGLVDIISLPVATTGSGSVLVWPSPPTLPPNTTINLTAIVLGTANQEVLWRIQEENGGTITNTGVYTAPASTGTYKVTATSVADPTKSATVTVQVRMQSPMIVVSPSGPGVFTIQANYLENIAAIDLTIKYDPATLANPQVAAGSLTSGAMTAINTSVLGTVRFALVKITPISGSGTLATLSFDPKGPTPGRILSLTFTLINAAGGSVEGIPIIPALPPPTNASNSHEAAGTITVTAPMTPPSGMTISPINP